MLGSRSSQGKGPGLGISNNQTDTACGRSATAPVAVIASAALALTALGFAAAVPGTAALGAEHHKGGAAHQTKAGAKNEKNKKAAHGASGTPLPAARPAMADLPPDLITTEQAIALIKARKQKDAIMLATSVGDPVAQKLVEWVALRHPDTDFGFERYAAFVRANPDWPSIPLFRKRAEVRLWQERRDGATLRRFVGDEPASAVGRLAHARLLLGEGDREGAAAEVRTVWRTAELSPELESVVLDTFHDLLTPTDFVARMDRRIGAKEFGIATRAAKHLGDSYVAIVKACAAAEDNEQKGGALLDAVAADLRDDPGYALCRVHWLVKHDELAAAAKVALAAEQQDLQWQDTDEWWRELRMLARKLIDHDDAQSAYQIAAAAPTPANPYYRADAHFMAGWIALRFLDDPRTALRHFGRIDEGMADPIVLARAGYWRGRAAEAAGLYDLMRAQYEAAARHSTAYYGQLARARLGRVDVALRAAPRSLDAEAREVVHAADILYAVGERDLALSFVSDLADQSADAATLSALGAITAHYNDAQAMLVVGKTALAKGLPLDEYAFPDIGVPAFNPVGPQLDRCIVYSIVRTESGFDQRDTSSAMAVGLMQVTPEAGRDTAKRFGVAYDWKRMVHDPVYNTQMGAAEVAALLKEYRGSYIMTFAGYNAGRGRVRDWVAAHGDPRDPNVDAVDWVERIPISETRNYVQRVIENLQVYRARLGEKTPTLEPNLHRVAGQ